MISICSEGNESDFNELKESYVDFYLNKCVKTTFHMMVKAKVLIVAKSSFSYAAGILN